MVNDGSIPSLAYVVQTRSTLEQVMLISFAMVFVFAITAGLALTSAGHGSQK